MSDEKVWHVCKTLRELECPYVPSLVGWCVTCGERIWVDPLSCAEIRRPLHEHACTRCAVAAMEPGDTVQPPSDRQIEAMRGPWTGSN